ncbi:hypothetical protein [Microcoleus sp. S28C3]|uniref:hypothetical protein n=1 Tax=Microcoleus sp. S28C3 TaxID=3055414 RepID=UPI00403F2CBA
MTTRQRHQIRAKKRQIKVKMPEDRKIEKLQAAVALKVSRAKLPQFRGCKSVTGSYDLLSWFFPFGDCSFLEFKPF